LPQTDQLKRINELLEHCKSAPFYRERLSSEPLSSLDELKGIPVLTKEDLRRHSPYGLLCADRKELCQYHESSGTTGVPVSSWFTKGDVRYNAREIARCGVGFHQNDTVLVRFPYALSAAAHMIHAAVQSRGACVIPAGGRTTVTPFPRVVNLMKKLDVTVLTCLSLQAVMVAETAEIMGLRPSRDFPHLRAICTAGEPLTHGRRKLLEDIWQAPIFDFYGMTEIGTAVVDCEYGQPHALDDYFTIELLDDDLQSDVSPGELGNLVITTLKKRATPMVRYLTGDRARYVDQKCSCGRERSLEVHGRREDTVSVSGRILDLWDLEDIVSHFPCRRYWAVCPVQGGLHFLVEEENIGERITSERVGALESQYNLVLQIDFVPKGTIYDRDQMLSVGLQDKPRYIYTAQEVEQIKYRRSGSETWRGESQWERN
jgi:phenylacetate-CoA ligase